MRTPSCKSFLPQHLHEGAESAPVGDAAVLSLAARCVGRDSMALSNSVSSRAHKVGSEHRGEYPQESRDGVQRGIRHERRFVTVSGHKYIIGRGSRGVCCQKRVHMSADTAKHPLPTVLCRSCQPRCTGKTTPSSRESDPRSSRTIREPTTRAEETTRLAFAVVAFRMSLSVYLRSCPKKKKSERFIHRPLRVRVL